MAPWAPALLGTSSASAAVGLAYTTAGAPAAAATAACLAICTLLTGLLVATTTGRDIAIWIVTAHPAEDQPEAA